ncbi:MAG: ABC transporter substrate-binding protein/permease [Lachnospiraceae bacterium]|nr:ABC transporter substrate-binding protein/permease [Lachnospiraceae bacterium]
MKRSIGLALLAAIVLTCLAGVTTLAKGDEITSKEQLKEPGRRIGCGIGSSAMLFVEDEFPEAILVYQEANEGYESVAQGKIDAYAYDRRQMQLAIDSGRKGVRLLDENLEEKVHVAVGISPKSKIHQLQEQLNTFIELSKADGTIDEMYDRWVVQGNEEMPDIPRYKDSNTILVVGTSGIVPPHSYYRGQELNGFDIELAYRFAAYIDADVTFKVYDYSSIIPAAASGDVDCIMANLNITPERAEALPFSEDIYTEDVGLMVRDTSSVGEGFIKSLKMSFEKTFIREDRWRLFVNGILTTLLITVLSVIAGTALGFVVFLACKDGNPAANAITRVCMWLVCGMPAVVLIMILYYIVFGNISVNGIFVSVLAFTLIFGSSVFGLLKMGVGAVDVGQYEAAYALGYSRQHTFFKIILPQALPHVMEAYKSGIVELIKATAIVGYIAVQDLTKIGDIVRSRTYEAFFPLIAIAVIYFLLEAFIGLFISRIHISILPEKRGRDHILRGIDTHDKD